MDFWREIAIFVKDMGNKRELLKRVREMEARYDELARILDELDEAVAAFERFGPELQALRESGASSRRTGSTTCCWRRTWLPRGWGSVSEGDIFFRSNIAFENYLLNDIESFARSCLILRNLHLGVR